MLAPVPFQLVPELHIAQVGIDLRRAQMDVAEGLLHHMQRGTFLHHLGAMYRMTSALVRRWDEYQAIPAHHDQ